MRQPKIKGARATEVGVRIELRKTEGRNCIWKDIADSRSHSIRACKTLVAIPAVPCHDIGVHILGEFEIGAVVNDNACSVV